MSRVPWNLGHPHFASFNELVHHLHVVHVDDACGFLYINSTNNASLHEDIAKAIGGDDIAIIKGDTVYRILAGVTRRFRPMSACSTP